MTIEELIQYLTSMHASGDITLRNMRLSFDMDMPTGRGLRYAHKSCDLAVLGFNKLIVSEPKEFMAMMAATLRG